MIRVASVLQPLAEDAAVLSAEDTRRLVIDVLKEDNVRSWKTNGRLISRCRLLTSALSRNACYVSGAIEANFDTSLLRSPI